MGGRRVILYVYKMIKNKKGQELSIGTLVLIVIGVIVLVLLVLGFSMGWSNLFSKIGIYQGSDETSAVTACRSYIGSNSLAGYCEFKDVKVTLDTTRWGAEKGKIKKLSINCEYFNDKFEGQKLECATEITDKYCFRSVDNLKTIGLNKPCPLG